MSKKLIIIGASGHGKVLADIAVKTNKWKNIFFLDDNEQQKECLGFKVIGKVSDAYLYKEEFDFIVGIGRNTLREKIQVRLENLGIVFTTLIHPNAVIGDDVSIGDGTVIMGGVVINSSTKINKGCIINTSSSIDHDNLLGEYVHISPGVNLAGSVTIGNRTWISIGSVVSNNVSICNDCILGAGTVTLKDITDSGVYIGIPSKKIK